MILLELAVEIGELAHRPRDERGVKDKASHLPDGDASGLQQRRPGPQDHHDGTKQGEDDEGDEGPTQPGPMQGHFQIGIHAPAVTADFEGFIHEGLHVEDALQGLLHDDAGLRQFVLRLP